MKTIPQAIICDPPEPTVIDESDLAPGMVVTLKSFASGWTWWAEPTVTIDHEGWVDKGSRKHSQFSVDDDCIRWVATGVR